MVESDFTRFIGVWDNLHSVYGKPTSQPDGYYKVIFSVLADYPIEHIENAVVAHMRNPNNGQFMPKPADLIAIIDGKSIDTDQVLCEARARETPFGVLAAMSIGSWNLKNLSERELKPYALEVVRKVDEWKATKGKGQYTDHEALTMLKHGVQINQPFMANMQPPINIDELRLQYRRVKDSEEYKLIADRIESKERENMPVNPDGINRIKKMMIGLDSNENHQD